MASIAELILERGRQQAESRRQEGQIAGQTWQHLANIIASTGSSIAKERAEAPIRAQEAELRTAQLAGSKADTALKERTIAQDAGLSKLLNSGTRPTLQQLVAAGGVERGMSIAQGMHALEVASENDVQMLAKGLSALPEKERAQYYPAARQKLIERGRIGEQDAPKDFDPQWWSTTMGQMNKPLTAKDVADIGKTTAETKKLEAEVAGTLPLAPAQAETSRHNKEMEAIGHLTAGRQDATAAEVARHNRAMEENARNTKLGRPVIAGDAEDLSNFVTSLDDLKVLRSTIAPVDKVTGKPVSGATGVGAQIGAAIPSAITDITGWGVEAKQKQALIDRVKQVIGKTLEGGVLRKEDELKYEKILPTIKDTGELVQSKLQGLEDAIAKRFDRRLESLSDAGFNVDRYRQRQATNPEKPQATSLSVGQVVTVKGKRVKVTAVHADGTFDGEDAK